MKKSKYNLIFWFSLSPFCISIFFSFLVLLLSIVYGEYSSIPTALMISTFGVFYMPPAFILGVVCYFFRIRKGALSYIFVGCFGGVLAKLWTFYIVGWGNFRLIPMGEFLKGGEFYLGLVAAVVSSILFLPKRDQ